MDKVLDFFHLNEEGSLRRVLAFLFGAAGVVLAPQLSKLGISVDDVQIQGLAAVVAGYLIQSGMHAAGKQLARAKEAAQVASDSVATVEDAKKVVEDK